MNDKRDDAREEILDLVEQKIIESLHAIGPNSSCGCDRAESETVRNLIEVRATLIAEAAIAGYGE